MKLDQIVQVIFLYKIVIRRCFNFDITVQTIRSVLYTRIPYVYHVYDVHLCARKTLRANIVLEVFCKMTCCKTSCR